MAVGKVWKYALKKGRKGGWRKKCLRSIPVGPRNQTWDPPHARGESVAAHHGPCSISQPSCAYRMARAIVQSPPAMFMDIVSVILERFSRAGPRGRGREWATLGVHPLSWLFSNNRLEEVCGTLTTDTFSSRLLLSNQDKGYTPSVAHSLPLPLGPALLNLWTF